MAHIVFDPPIRTISGGVGGFIYRRQRDGSVIVAQRALPNVAREPSAAQKASRERFRVAAARYRDLLQDPPARAGYEQILAGRGPLSRLRAVIIGDILQPPVIRAMELAGYHGQRGAVITVLAEDNVAVARLVLEIFDRSAGCLVERAEQTWAGEQLTAQREWLHVTGESVPADHEIGICVTASDLAGNSVTLQQSVISGLPPETMDLPVGRS